jgi:hypothetical protein
MKLMGRVPHRKADWLALAGAVIMVGVHLILVATRHGPSAGFIASACLFWMGFILVRVRQDKHVLRDWGFRRDNLGRTAGLAALVFAVAAAGLAGYAARHGTLSFPVHALPLFLVYSVWGVIQQFLALGIVVNNLERIRGLGEKKVLLVFLIAGLFGLIHFYDTRLAVGTLLLELVTVPLFLRYRNLLPLGVLHGWLGGLFYLWVLNRDLWAETFG